MKALIVFITLMGLVIASAASLKPQAPRYTTPQFDIVEDAEVDNMPESCFDIDGEFNKELCK